MMDVLLVSGGKGTRSKNPSIAKSLQRLTPSIRVIDTISDSLNTVEVGKIIGVLGYFYNEQLEAFSKIPWPSELVITSSIDKGTSHAVASGMQLASSDWVAIVAADSALSFDFGALLQFAESSNSDVVFSARYSNHPHDSDSLVIGSDAHILDFKPKGNAAQGVIASVSGVVLVRRKVIKDLPLEGDFQFNLFEMIKNKRIPAKAWISRFYCRDTGTPERLAQASTAFTHGHAQFRGRRDIGAIFIDRDGTLIPDIGDSRKQLNSGDLPPEIAESFLEANRCGVPIFITTNQPGVAKGKITNQDVEQTIGDIQRELSLIGAFFDDYRFCPHHPEKGWPGEIADLKISCYCRKPFGDMAFELANHHFIDLSKSFVIGDSEPDQGFATSIGSGFIRVNRGEPATVSQAIRYAIREIRHAS